VIAVYVVVVVAVGLACFAFGRLEGFVAGYRACARDVKR
jgi:hypothetical protein